MKPEGYFRLSYLTAPFDPASATGKMYGKDDNGYVSLLSCPPFITEVYVPRGADKQWYNLEIPVNDMKGFISGEKENYGFMLSQWPLSMGSFICTDKYYISSEHDSTHLRPKLVVVYGDTPVSMGASVVKTDDFKQSIFYHDKNDIIIKAGLPEVASLSVYNIQGKLIAKRLLKDEASVLSLNKLVKEYSSGIYFCTLIYAGEKYSIRFKK